MSNTQKGKIRAFLGKRQFRYGWYAAAITVLVIAIVVVVNLAVGAIEDKWALTVDVSANSVTTLSNETKEVLDGIDQDVHIYTLFQEGTQAEVRTQLEGIINRYRARNDRITVSNIDPVKDPTRVNSYQKDSATTLSEGSLIVTNGDESRVKTIRYRDLYDTYYNQQTGQQQITGFTAEKQLTSAVMYVTSESTPKVYFLSGHQEVEYSNLSTFRQYLSNENYDVAELSLTGSAPALGAGDTVMVLSPKTDLTDEERDLLKAFLTGGGRMTFAMSPTVEMDKLPNFQSLLSLYGVGFKEGVVIEEENNPTSWINYPYWIVPTMEEHDITKAVKDANGRLIIPSPRGVQLPDMPISGIQYAELLSSSDSAYVKAVDADTSDRADGDEVGRQILAYSVLDQDYEDSTKDVRILLVGTSDLYMDSVLLTGSNNLDFLMSSMEWLVNRDMSVSIRSKTMKNTTLSIPDAGSFWIVGALVVVVIPVLVLVAGIWVWFRRRHL